MSSKAYLMLGLPLAASLVACSGARPDGGDGVVNIGAANDQASSPAPAGVGAEAPPRIAEWQRSGASLLARRSGKLAVAGGCLVLVGEGGSATLPIFPAGAASWSADGALAYKGKRYALGDAIELPGGAISAEEAERRGIAGLAGCPAEAMFLVN